MREEKNRTSYLDLAVSTQQLIRFLLAIFKDMEAIPFMFRDFFKLHSIINFVLNSTTQSIDISIIKIDCVAFFVNNKKNLKILHAK